MTLKFSELGIESTILKSLEERSFEKPTQIQLKAIPILLSSSKDFVGYAQTGTGKTLAFTIPIVQKVDANKKNIQAIILSPTRELATQIDSEIKKITKYTDVKSTCVYGGVDYEKQVQSLKRDKPQIVVGTPGRVIDLIRKNFLKLDKANICVLDEADEMLSMGFFEDIEFILKRFKNSKQLMMFSATISKSVQNLISKSFGEYDYVEIEKKVQNDAKIDQQYFSVKEKHFKEALARLIDYSVNMYGIVFCRTKLETKDVADDLKKRGYSVDVLNGDMGQVERDHAMNNFKKKKVNILVCTDVAARGIDVDSLTHVINFGPPRDNESYVHRIGRTGRAGMQGIAYTIISPKHINIIKTLENHTKSKITKSSLPKIEDLKRISVEKDLDNAKFILDAIKKKGADFKTEPSFDLFLEHFGDLEKEDLLKAMFVWKFNKTMRHYNNLSDIESEQLPKVKKKKKNNRLK